MLVKCPECSNQVSSYAEQCIHCGYPFKPESENEAEETSVPLPDDPEERMQLAIDANTPAEVLEKLAQDENGNVRIKTAENLSTPADVLRELAYDYDFVVRQYAAENPNTPAEVLQDVVNSGDRSSCIGAAKNPSTPPEALKLLARYGGRMARMRVAANPSTPIEVWNELLNDEDDWVRRVASDNAPDLAAQMIYNSQRL